MSGGVDSSVAACLLAERGFNIIGLFMRVGADPVENEGADGGVDRSSRKQGCCSASDASDARFVAGKLGVPFFALNFKREFDQLIDEFSDAYAAGRTPNPCVVCNQKFKFGRLMAYADAVGAEFVATGHYARIQRNGAECRLARSADAQKDQTYVLFGLSPAVLPRVLFPLGDLTKADVRREAHRFGLPNADKPDSVEICFVPDQDYARVVRSRRPDAFRDGDVVDSNGQVVGRHRGLPRYTIGQRRGLGIAVGEPIYVTRLNVLDNTVTVGPRGHLLKRELTVNGINLLRSDVGATFRADVKIRYHHEPSPATVTMTDGIAQVVFDEPQSAPTPGQAAVFYNDDVVVGGGWIDQVMDEPIETSPALAAGCPV
ncbi:MAG: tRNA 2-thiouridine(34) synthase MnmA [Phycisphaerales bacterium]|nr:tRNA 2-thiouridine(34) synthase MnmA [Phycisphaerales bacterium]